MENYDKSFQELKNYLKTTNSIPSEQKWNKYCIEQNLLSSKSMEYMYGKKFNKMCRELIKEVHKNK